jgi:protein MAK11
MDERIRLYNAIDKRSLGEVSNQTGKVTSLKFYGDSFLFSGSEDSTISVWRVHDWVCLHILGGHKGEITDLSIHPSGKLCLSVSKDNTMKLWNLVQGKLLLLLLTNKLQHISKSVI